MGVPIRVLPLQDVDDVVQDLRVVGVQGRGPGQHHTPGVKLHGQWLPWSAGNVWTLFELEYFFWKKLMKIFWENIQQSVKEQVWGYDIYIEHLR